MELSAFDGGRIGLTNTSIYLKQHFWELFLMILFLHGAPFCVCAHPVCSNSAAMAISSTAGILN